MMKTLVVVTQPLLSPYPTMTRQATAEQVETVKSRLRPNLCADRKHQLED